MAAGDFFYRQFRTNIKMRMKIKVKRNYIKLPLLYITKIPLQNFKFDHQKIFKSLKIEKSQK